MPIRSFLFAAAMLAALTAPAAAQVREPGSGPFGEQVMLQERVVLSLQGRAAWDEALDRLSEAFRRVYAFIGANGLVADGPAMTIYRATDDEGFNFEAAVPVVPPATPPAQGAEVSLGRSPGGSALRFSHRGTFDDLEMTYEQVAGYLDDRSIIVNDVFIEQYASDLPASGSGEVTADIFVFPRR